MEQKDIRPFIYWTIRSPCGGHRYRCSIFDMGICLRVRNLPGETYDPYSQPYSGMDSFINAGGYINGSGVFIILLSLLALGVIFLDRIQKMMPGNNQLNGIIASVKTKSNIILIVFGALIVLIAGLDMAQLNSTNAQVSSALSSQYATLISLYGYSVSASANPGIGLYLALIAGLVLLVSGFIGIMQVQKHPFVQHQNMSEVSPRYQQPGQQYGPAAPQNQTYQQPAPAQQYQQPVQQQYAPSGNPTARTRPRNKPRQPSSAATAALGPRAQTIA